MNIEQARFNMIEQQIRPWNVLDASVLALLGVVKREDFVPTAYRAMAFTDTELPLGEGQFMLAPRVEARMLQALKVERHEKVLEIGTGSGYMAALLGHKAQQVFTLETKTGLAAEAMTRLRRAGVLNVTVRVGDGAQGLASEGPFDAIVLSGSVAQVPQALLQQLKAGGRLLAVVGCEPVMRATLYTPEGQGTELFDTVLPRLEGFETLSGFTF